MNIRLSLIKQIDSRAWFPLAALIHSYLQNHHNVGAVEICENEIRFTKGVFFTLGRINYTPYQIVCRNGVIYYEGAGIQNVPKREFGIRKPLKKFWEWNIFSTFICDNQ